MSLPADNVCLSVQVGEVILPKSSRGAVINASAIIMSFIGVGFSMFSLSRLQDSSERRAFISDVLKWSTSVRWWCVYFHRGVFTTDEIASVCFVPLHCAVQPVFLVHKHLQYFIYVARTVRIYHTASVSSIHVVTLWSVFSTKPADCCLWWCTVQSDVQTVISACIFLIACWFVIVLANCCLTVMLEQWF